MKLKEGPVARDEREREMARRERQARRSHENLVGYEIAPTVPPAPPVTVTVPPRLTRPPETRPARRGFFVIPFLILISLGAGAVATIALMKTKPTAQFNAQVATLTAHLTRADDQITKLHAQVASTASQTRMRTLEHEIAGLRKTLGGVQNTVVPLKAKLAALGVCLPQLQEEVTGIGAHATKHGITTVGLSPECSQVLSSVT